MARTDDATAPARYLGIDVGTTSTKAIAFAEDGTALATAAAGYEISRPDAERAEQNAEDWLRAVDDCVQQVAARLDLSSVAGVGITGQIDTHVLVDEELNPLRPALLWQDIRSSGDAAVLNAHVGESDRERAWGSPSAVDASNPVPRCRWLARNDPVAWNQSRWLLLPKDFINARLTGVVRTDAWASFKVVGRDGVYVPGVEYAPGLAQRLAPLAQPETIVGQTREGWHGIPAGTPVATGTMDALSNVLGSGLDQPGDAMAVLGTSVIVGAIGVGGTSGPGVVTFAPYGGRHIHAGPTQAGGEALRWWANLTGHTVSEVLESAAGTQAGAGGVVFAPHLLGERAPLWDHEVRAWFTGLSASVGFAEMSRAVLEGVAHSLRELMEAVEVAAGVATPVLRLSGGGSRTDLCCQVIADVTGRTVHRAAEADTAVVGAAALAAAAATGQSPWGASGLAGTDRVFLADASATRIHDALHSVYRETYHSLKEVHAALAKARAATGQPAPANSEA